MVLVSTRNPLNIGAAARAMANFGFPRLRVVNPYDVAFREARSAVGAAPLLAAAEEFAAVAEAVADCRLVVGTTSVGHRELQQPLRRLEYGARLIRRTPRLARPSRCSSAPRNSASPTTISATATGSCASPPSTTDLSMNLGQAVALCLYELARDPRAAAARRPERSAPPPPPKPSRSPACSWKPSSRSGYINPITAASTEKKSAASSAVSKSPPATPVLLGMLRQILWKLGE